MVVGHSPQVVAGGWGGREGGGLLPAWPAGRAVGPTAAPHSANGYSGIVNKSKL